VPALSSRSPHRIRQSILEQFLNRQEERYVRNEWLFRDVNERIAEVNEKFEVEGETEFLCECGQQMCLETLLLTRAQYEAVRGKGRRFVVVPGHEDGRVERVVERESGFLVVEKIGEVGEESEEQNPRS
jgi:hypothetical protein